MSLLERRVAAIERRVFGETPDSSNDLDIKQRLGEVEGRLEGIEGKIADFLAIKPSLLKYSLFLKERRVPLQQMSEKAEYINATRHVIEKHLNMLSIIKDLSHIAEADLLQNALESKLLKVLVKYGLALRF